MDVSVVAVGRLKAGSERDLLDRYLERARKTGQGLGFRGFSVREIAESRGARATERLAQEASALLAALPERAYSVCLDEKGELLGSQAFAEFLRGAVTGGQRPLVFVIGGPDGIDRALLDRADRRLAFGSMTWPHQIVRILLAEQLYRAMTILSGHPYHRA